MHAYPHMRAHAHTRTRAHRTQAIGEGLERRKQLYAGYAHAHVRTCALLCLAWVRCGWARAHRYQNVTPWAGRPSSPSLLRSSAYPDGDGDSDGDSDSERAAAVAFDPAADAAGAALGAGEVAYLGECVRAGKVRRTQHPLHTCAHAHARTHAHGTARHGTGSDLAGAVAKARAFGRFGRLLDRALRPRPAVLEPYTALHSSVPVSPTR
jgi:hypothetical protein